MLFGHGRKGRERQRNLPICCSSPWLSTWDLLLNLYPLPPCSTDCSLKGSAPPMALGSQAGDYNPITYCRLSPHKLFPSSCGARGQVPLPSETGPLHGYRVTERPIGPGESNPTPASFPVTHQDIQNIHIFPTDCLQPSPSQILDSYFHSLRILTAL